MAAKHLIAPFPDNIDREHFASWLSGFCDGEANFYLGGSKNTRTVAVAKFALALRDDDAGVLRLIHSFFQVGYVNRKKVGRNSPLGSNPQISYNVGAVHDLRHVIVPHFDRYPLFAKKRRDFAIWREGVVLRASVVPARLHENRRGGGFRPNWDRASVAHFRQLSEALRVQRRYNAPEMPAVVAAAPRLQPSLFDAIDS